MCPISHQVTSLIVKMRIVVSTIYIYDMVPHKKTPIFTLMSKIFPGNPGNFEPLRDDDSEGPGMGNLITVMIDNGPGY